MEQIYNCLNPLENPLILDKVFSFCNVNDLKTCRAVNHTWNSVTAKALSRRKGSCIVKLSNRVLNNITEHFAFLESRFDFDWTCKYSLCIDLSELESIAHTLEIMGKIVDIWDDKGRLDFISIVWPENIHQQIESISESLEEFLNNIRPQHLRLDFQSIKLPSGMTIKSFASYIARIVNSSHHVQKLDFLLENWSAEFDGIECKVIAEAFKQIHIWNSVMELEFPMDMSDAYVSSLEQTQFPHLQHMKINFPAGITEGNSRMLQQHIKRSNCPSLLSVYFDFENPVFLIDFRLTGKDEKFFKGLPEGVKLFSNSSNKISMIASMLDFF